MAKFKAHSMYSKTGVKKSVKTQKDHLSLKKKGYTETKKKG